MSAVYGADRSLVGKLRRRLCARLARRPAPRDPGRALLTVSFDDAPLSAARAGAALLEDQGARGVFFLSAGLFGRPTPMGPCLDAEDAADLARRGHEIGCHTLGHLDCARIDEATLAEDLRRNGRAISALAGRHPTAFAYPYGEVSLPAKRLAARIFRGARALRPGLVMRGSDLAQSPAVGVEGPDGEARALVWLERAARRGAWLTLFTHDVQAQPSPFGCTPEALSRILDRARRLDIDIVNFSAGLDAVGAP